MHGEMRRGPPAQTKRQLHCIDIFVCIVHGSNASVKQGHEEKDEEKNIKTRNKLFN